MIQLPFIVTIQPDELLYSFILRVMKANGFESVVKFSKNCIQASKRSLSYDVGYDLYEFLDNIGYEDIQSFYLNTTIYKGIYPLIEKQIAASYFSKRPNKPMIYELKYCPICKKEDKVFYYHRAHQMPGVTVCYKHGCALNTYIGPQHKELEEPLTYVTNKVYNKSLEYAIFTKELLDEGIQISLEDTLKLIPKDIDYDNKMKEYLELIDTSPNDFLNNIRTSSTRYSKEILLVMLLFLYKNVSNLITHITKNDSEINKGYKLLSIYRSDLVEVKCLNCNTKFLAVPGQIKCYKCYRKDVIINTNKKTKVPTTLPDEFKLVNKATNSIYAVIKHTVCGKMFRCNYYNFYRRPKCKICSDIYEKQTSDDNVIYDERIIGITQKDSVYDWIKANFSEDDIIFSEEVNFNNLPRMVITDNIKKHVKQGFLKSLDRGIYCFPNKTFTTDEVISERFVVHKGTRIGYYCGEAFLYAIGLSKEKPKRITIVTNKVETLHGRSVYIQGVEVRIYGSRVEITDNNYAILAVIRFFINQTRCNYKVEGNYYYDIYKWLDRLNIKETDFKEYYPYFQDWIQGRIKNVYREGKLCEG